MILWTCTGKQKVFFLKSHAAFSDTYSLNSYEIKLYKPKYQKVINYSVNTNKINLLCII